MTLHRWAIALSIAAGAYCSILHIATFIAAVPGWLLLPPFAMLFATVLCTKITWPGWLEVPFPRGRYAILGLVLLAYSIAWFVFIYKSTGGATSVGIVDGQYVSMNKGLVIQTITERQYKMFPALVARVMSSWIAMMVMFQLAALLQADESTRY